MQLRDRPKREKRNPSVFNNNHSQLTKSFQSKKRTLHRSGQLYNCTQLKFIKKTKQGRQWLRRDRNPSGGMCAMFEGPAMVIVWLSTPAIVAIGSVGAGLAFHAISRLWAAERE
jgi:hypothetical protein